MRGIGDPMIPAEKKSMRKIKVRMYIHTYIHYEEGERDPASVPCLGSIQNVVRALLGSLGLHPSRVRPMVGLCQAEAPNELQTQRQIVSFSILY
tara:strand:- start:147 stop:428 length:282 start_codon:yes stop_codon:yes gene_type:complete